MGMVFKAKKTFLIILLITAICVFQKTFAQNSLHISKGVMLRAYPLKTISTYVLNENDTVYFINPSDIWVEEVNALPKDTLYKGYVEMLKMPVKGVNAAIVMRIDEIIYPNGDIRKTKGTVLYKGTNDIIGGNLTPPASYNKTVHPREGMYWKRAGVLQFVPSGEYEMGQHITIPTSENVFIRLDEDL